MYFYNYGDTILLVNSFSIITIGTSKLSATTTVVETSPTEKKNVNHRVNCDGM